MRPTGWVKFSFDDWVSDPDLARCSLAAQGLWMRMLWLMHRGEPRGYLRSQAGPCSVSALSQVLRCHPQTLGKLLAELEQACVFSRADDGAIYSRRMVRDEQEMQRSREFGKMGGNPALVRPLNPPDKAPLKIEKRREEKRRGESQELSLSTSKSSQEPPSPESVLRSQNLRSAILRWKPDHRLATPSAWTPAVCNRWARDIDLLNQRDNVSWERIDAVLAWLPTDGFWPANIQSGAKLREKFDRLEAELRKPRLRGVGPEREDYRFLGGEK